MSLGLCAVYAWAVVGASGEGWSGGKVEQLVEGEKTLGEIGGGGGGDGKISAVGM